MAFAQLANAWSRLSRHQPDITPESAALTCHKLQVSSAKARREPDYVEPPLDRVLAVTLEWMYEQRLIGRSA